MQIEQNFCDEFCTKPRDNVEVLTKENICSVIQKSLAKIIAKEGYKNYNIVIKVLTTEGGNYLGELYEIDVNGQTKNGRKVTNIFVKHVPNNDFITTAISLNICYNNELFVYNELSNVFNELYEEAGLPEEEKFKMVKYYPESNAHALFFENLNRKRYETLHRTHIMTLGFAKSAIKELAKFHALSFILSEKRRDFFEKNIKTLKSPIFYEKKDDEKYRSYHELLKKMINISFDCIEVDLDRNKERVEYFCNKMFDIMTINNNDETASVKCMCHGDFKAVNMLMKENDDGETETITIDYQLLNYRSPIYDFLYFIYAGTDRKFRKNHLEYLKNIYHDTLTEFLKFFDLDVNDFYPRKIFEKDFEEKLDYGLLVGVFFLPIFLIDEPDFLKNGIDSRTPGLHSSFKERISGVFQDYIEWGIL